jgi:integrase
MGTRRGFGRVRQLRSGRWQAGHVVMRDGSPVKVNAPSTFATEDEADAWLRGERVDLERGLWRDPGHGRETFGDYATEWIGQRELTPTTRGHYAAALRLHLLPRFGSTRLDAITPRVVKSWHAGLLRDRPAMRAHAYSLFKTIMAEAVRDELVDRNPCTVRGASQSRTVHEPEVMTRDEERVIVEAMPPRLRMMVQLASWCALRFGELAELRRGDVDLDRSLLRIRRAVVHVRREDGERVVGTPKTRAGRRDVPVPPHLAGPLRAHLDAWVKPDADALLFPSAHGRQLQARVLYDSWHPARRAAGRDDLHFHDLRHTALTRAGDAGATLKELMTLAGHTTPGMVVRYQHATEDRLQDLARRMSDGA